MYNLKPLQLVASTLFFALLAFILTSSKTLSSTKTTSTNSIQQDSTKWVAPKSADSLINPFESTEENIANGKLIFRKSCRSCHGKDGDGKGAGAIDLSTVVPSFIDKDFVKQSDGSMFWKITEGRKDMKSFRKELEKDDIWLVITYIKTFSSSSEN